MFVGVASKYFNHFSRNYNNFEDINDRNEEIVLQMKSSTTSTKILAKQGDNKFVRMEIVYKAS